MKNNETKNFRTNRINRIRITLASSSTIKNWASRTTITNYRIRSNKTIKYCSFKTKIFGEITTPEISITKRNVERYVSKGLFSEEIFGPINSFNCLCKEQSSLFKECPICNVTLTFSKIRAYRFGYIPLIFPVFNTLILLGSSNVLKILFDLTHDSFVDFIYFNFPRRSYYKLMVRAEKAFNAQEELYDFVDIEHIAVGYRRRRVNKSQSKLDEIFRDFDKYLKEHLQLLNKTVNGPKYKYNLFNEMFYNFLDSFDLKKELHFILSGISYKNYNKSYYNLLSKRLRIIENFYKTNTPLSSLMFKSIPVIPPYYRPADIHDIDGSKSSIFNKLYQYVLQINDKLDKIINSNLSNKEYLLITETRTLQESIDFLIDHNKIKKNNLINGRPTKSFADIIKGKAGRFRKNILGKRINFSARSVIVVNPLLRVNQCGLPLNMLISLLTPKINNVLYKLRISLKDNFNTKQSLYFFILKNIIKNEVVLLNRAPTLHKLGLQTFNVVITASDAIQLHPLVCAAYNADFDGDQMAVYLPLTKLSYIEYNSMLKATKELFLFGNSNLKMKPSQELILGLNYLSVGNEMIKNFGFGNYFYNYDDFFSCFVNKRINIHNPLWIKNKMSELNKLKFDNNLNSGYIRSTAGRLLLNKVLNRII